MMEFITIDQVLEAVDSLIPNSFDRGEKIAWLSSLDGELYLDVVLTHEGQSEAFSPYGLRDGARHLLVPEPYGRELYLAWIESRMAHYNGDTVRYNNGMDRVKVLVKGYCSWYNRTHRPIGKMRRFW